MGISQNILRVLKNSVSFFGLCTIQSISVLCTSPRNISLLEKVYGYDILGICTNEKIGSASTCSIQT